MMESGARWSEAGHPIWRTLLATCALVTALPLWSGRYLPFTDFPEHTAAIASLRHWFDPAWHMRETFTLDLAHTSYSLYYLAGAALAFVLGSAERANVVLLSLIAIAFPYSARALLRALGRDERLALFACPLFWTQSLLIGFFNYLAALPMLVWLLALVVRQLSEPSLRREIMLAVGCVLLFYMHLSAVVFLLPATLLAVVHFVPRARWRSAPRLLMWLAPLALVAIAFLLTSTIVHPARAGWHEPRTVTFEPLDQELAHVAGSLLDIWLAPEDEWCFFGLLAAGIALTWPRASEEGPRDPTDVRARSLIASWLVLASAYYFLLPQKVGWLWQLNERYAVLFALLAPALLRPAAGLRGAVPLLCAAGVAVLTGSNATVKIHAFQEEVGPFDAVLAQAKPGKHLLALVFEQRSRVARFSPFLHYGAYYRARGGGVNAPSFAELPQSPLKFIAGAEPPSQPSGWEWEPWRFENDVRQSYFDYILVRGPDPGFLGKSTTGPCFTLVERQGRWALFTRTDLPGSCP
jgi:hypothetical protein